jgi:uncharacterized protein with FMN-binding domain
MDPEQEKYRELFQTLEKESTAARAARRSGKVANRVVGAGCAAVVAIYGAGYARTQSAAERFAQQLAVRRVAALPVPGLSVKLDRNNVSHPRVETFTMPTGKLPEHVAEASVTEGKHRPARSAAPDTDRPHETKSAPDAPAIPAPADAAPPAAATPAFAPPPVIERQADAPPPAKPADPAPVAPATPATPAQAAQWKDGTYTGWGYSRHGNIEATVIIANGRITSATISQCRTRYSCSVIERLPPQVAARQSAEVDYVSGATQSADAFYGAVVEALGKAK